MIKRISGQPKKKKKKEKKLEENEEKQIVIINNIQPPPANETEIRAINLYGDLTEQKGAEVVGGLLFLENSSIVRLNESDVGEKEDPTFVARSITMMVSTHGGVASEMFSILDVMDMIKQRIWF